MTEAEILELIGIFNANALTSLTVFISFTISYLMVAYFIGAKLSRVQVLITSVIYVMLATGMMLSTIANVLAWHNLQKQLPADSEVLDAFIWNGAMWVGAIPIGLVVGMLVSLYFMYDSRNSRANR